MTDVVLALQEKVKFERELQSQLADKGRSGGGAGEGSNSSSTSSSILGSFSSLTGTHYSEEELGRMIKDRENAIK